MMPLLQNMPMNTSIDTEKQHIREQIKKQRSELAADSTKKSELDALIAMRLLEMPEVQDAHTILIYESYRTEVNTSHLIGMFTDLGKTVVVPHVESMDPPEMTLRHKEDTRSHVDPSAIECAIIPGLAFDHKFNRLGFGKGFFDRLFKVMTCPKIALAYDFQIVQNVPANTYDEKVSHIITPTEIYEH